MALSVSLYGYFSLEPLGVTVDSGDRSTSLPWSREKSDYRLEGCA